MSTNQRQSRLPGPFSLRVIAAIAGLTVLFAVLAPDASQPLGFVGRVLFWFLHIALGLASALIAARAMVVSFAVPRDWRLILFSGACGVLLFAPVAYVLEIFFPLVHQAPDGDWTGDAGTGVLAAMLLKAAELAPSYLAAWFLVNLESLTAAFRPVLAADEDERNHRPPQDERQAFLGRLPAAIGSDVVAVSSDLHYLRVHTTRGHAMILGSLQEVEDAFGGEGLRVHRSHWVAADHVRRLRQRGSRWFAEVNGGYSVPVSRRRRNEVVSRLRRDLRGSDSSETGATR